MKHYFFIPAISIMLVAGISFADTPDEKDILNIVIENDSLSNSGDSNYTNGIRLAWLSAESKTPPAVREFANNLLPVNNAGKKRISFALGQSMFTPSDLSRSDLIVEDRPYAGWLYTSIGIISDSDKILDSALVTVGVVGPYAFAEPSQKIIHRLIGSERPQGWDHQLNTEPGINLTLERSWRNMYQFSPFGVGMDATPHASATIGNVNTDMAIGATFRLGYDLPADYGPPRIRPSLPGSDFFIPTRELGGYLFAGFEGRAVGRNIFLDGNTFTDSHHVDKEILIGSMQTGLAITYNEMRFAYSHVFMTREFEGQEKPQQFGVFSMSWRF